MELEVCKTINKLITKLSTTGEKVVDAKGVKDLMHYAGKSEEYLKFTHERLLKQLRKKHAQIRLGTFLIINEFFKKSSFYRELLLDEFRTVLELTMGDGKESLPPPPEAAEELKQRVGGAFHAWNLKYAQKHHRLQVAYNYIKNVLKVNVEDSTTGTGVAEQPPLSQINDGASSRNMRELESLRKEIVERESDISELVTEMQNCFNLIVSKPEEFMGESVSCPSETAEEDIDLREHGFSAQTTITIVFNPTSATKIQINEDNETIIENLRGLYSRAKNRLMPLIRRWMQSVVEAGGDSEIREKLLQMKNSLTAEMSRFEELSLSKANADKILPSDVSSTDESDEDDDDDFEEVSEKEGYEEFAVAPPVIPKAVENTPRILGGTSQEQSSTSRAAMASWKIGVPETPAEFHDPTYGLRPDEMKVLSSTSKPSPSKPPREISERKAKLLALAPKVPFDVDLYHWEEKTLPTPKIEIADTGLHRFWQPLDREGEEIDNPEGGEALRTRTIAFTGEFEPVKWTCRAPLPSGKLCPRQDRVKCPFHGKVIPRDEQGNPTDPEDIERLKKEQEIAEKNKVPEWQDHKLLQELKEKIGIDLTIRPSKKGGKKFAEKYPNLADIRKMKGETSRSRLEKKIFSKRAVKRVAESLDTISKKRGRDKFGDQFNYSGE